MSRFLGLLALLFSVIVGAMPAQAKDYILSAGDVLRITVYDHPDLTTEARVNERGKLLFPLAGEIQASGGTAAQVQDRIAKALSDGGFITKPQVNVIVVQFKGQQINVLGFVNRPGKHPVEESSNLSDLLATAGGVAVTGADHVVVLRVRGGKTERKVVDAISLFEEGNTALDLDLADGDIVYVPREPKYYIFGEVQRPGAFRLERNMTVVQALSVGGGVTQRGTLKGLQILRRDAGGTIQTITPQLTDPVMKDDVIQIKESLF